MDEPVVLNEEAGKENEQTAGKCESSRGSYEQRWSRNWEVFPARAEIQKYSTQDLNACKKFCESLKESRKQTCQWVPFVNKMAPSTKRVHSVVSQRRFKRYLHDKGSLINILKDNEFSKSREVLAAKQRTHWKVWRLPPAHSTSTFSVVISRRSQGWIRTDHWAIEPQTGIKIRCTFGMKRTVILSSLIDEVCTKLDFEPLFLSRLDWRLVTEVSQLNAWARAGEQIYFFLSFWFLIWPYNKHLINWATIGRSVWENLDLSNTDLVAFGLYWRPRSRFSHTGHPLGTKEIKALVKANSVYEKCENNISKVKVVYSLLSHKRSKTTKRKSHIRLPERQ